MHWHNLVKVSKKALKIVTLIMKSTNHGKADKLIKVILKMSNYNKSVIMRKTFLAA